MMTTKSLTYKIASEPEEFEQIYRLNYKTFVGEIPQHEENEENRLVDRFDKENTYIICTEDDRIIGMLAVRSKRPFSLDQKLDDLDSFFSAERKMCEIRLLAVEKEYRNGRVFLGLAKELIDYCVRNDYDTVLISGTLRQLKLYKHLGFVSFGPIVGTEDAPYQPMYLTKEAFDKKEAMYRRLNALPKEEKPKELERQNVSFLPGPVQIPEKVRETFGERPISHRARRFVDDFQQVKHQLTKLVNARHVEMMLGSGTLGNDAVAAQISLLDGPGLIVTNGEFGERLLDHANRFGLNYKLISYDWGDSIDYHEVQEFLKQNPDTQWLWTVHCETSTGLLNRLEDLKAICREEKVKLCLDCCSSIGVVPVDLEGVFLASSSSGKGMSSLAGVAMVFYHHDIEPSQRLPRYLDIGLYASKDGVPFTHSSNLVYALNTALKRFESGEAAFKEIADLAQWLRDTLREKGYNIFGSDEDMTPGIVTIALPGSLNAESVGDELERAGYWLSYRSEYLLVRNWIQISLMGEHTKEELKKLLKEIDRATNQ